MDYRHVPRTIVNLSLVTAVLLGVVGHEHRVQAQEAITVDCNTPGQTLAAAMQAASPGDTIQFTGTCMETVTITQNDTILDGQGSGTIDGGGAALGDGIDGTLTIDGAKRVTIRGLTVQNGQDGIVATNGAAVSMTDVVSKDHADDGIQVVYNSSMQVGGAVTSMGNADDGIVVSDSSTLDIRDCQLTSSQNGDDGMSVFSVSSVSLINSTVQLIQNGVAEPSGDGLAISGASVVTTSDPGTVELVAAQNASRGIVVLSTSTLFLTTSSATMISNNGRDGIAVFNLSRAALGAGSTLVIDNNPEDAIQAAVKSVMFCSANSSVVLNNNGAAVNASDDSIVSEACLNLPGSSSHLSGLAAPSGDIDGAEDR